MMYDVKVLQCHSLSQVTDYRLNLLLWLLIADDFSGLSYWVLSVPGILSEDNSSIIPPLHLLSVSVMSISTYSNQTIDIPHSVKINNIGIKFTVSWVNCDLPHNMTSLLILWKKYLKSFLSTGCHGLLS